MAKGFTSKISEVSDAGARQIDTAVNTQVDKSLGILASNFGDIVSNTAVLVAEEGAMDAYGDAKETFEDIIIDSQTNPSFKQESVDALNLQNIKNSGSLTNSALINLRLTTAEKQLRGKYTGKRAQVVIDKIFGNPMQDQKDVASKAEASAMARAANLKAENVKIAGKTLSLSSYNGDADAMLKDFQGILETGGEVGKLNSSAASTKSGSGLIRKNLLGQLQLAQGYTSGMVNTEINTMFKNFSEVDVTDPVAFKEANRNIFEYISNFEENFRNVFPNLNDAEYSYAAAPAIRRIAEWKKVLDVADGGFSSSKSLEQIKTNMENMTKVTDAAIKLQAQNSSLYPQLYGLKQVLGDQALAVFLTNSNETVNKIKDLQISLGKETITMDGWGYLVKDILDPNPDVRPETGMSGDAAALAVLRAGGGSSTKTPEGKSVIEKTLKIVADSPLVKATVRNQEDFLSMVSTPKNIGILTDLVKTNPEEGVRVAQSVTNAVINQLGIQMSDLIRYTRNDSWGKGVQIENDNGRLTYKNFPNRRGSAPRKDSETTLKIKIKRINNLISKGVMIAPLTNQKLTPDKLIQTIGYELYNQLDKGPEVTSEQTSTPKKAAESLGGVLNVVGKDISGKEKEIKKEPETEKRSVIIWEGPNT